MGGRERASVGARTYRFTAYVASAGCEDANGVTRAWFPPLASAFSTSSYSQETLSGSLGPAFRL